MERRTDFLNPEDRSIRMRAVKSKNSKAELIVFKYLRKEDVYFQKHYKHAPGSPDVALPRKKKAVFIDGDFWHGRTISKVMERGPDDYWTKKILRNMDRDKAQEEALVAKGWRIIRIWEREILRKRTQQGALDRIKEFLVS